MPLIALPGIGELIVIFGVVFLLFGAKKLPELGGAIGESIKNFKKGVKDKDADAAANPNQQLPGSQGQAAKPDEAPKA